MKIWICIPVFNRINYTLQCLHSLQKQSYKNFTIIVCDHGSTDGTSLAIQQQFPEVVLINADSSLWWTGAINCCIRYALDQASSEDTLLTMNNDNEVPEDYLQNLLTNFGKYPNSIITSVIHDIKTKELISRGYRQNWLLATANEVDFARDHVPNDPEVVEVTHASGRGTLFPISAFRELGLFDEVKMPHYAADYDFTFRTARAGYRIYSCLNCKVYSYVEETGLVKVLNKFSIRSFIDYFFSIRSPGNLKVRWHYGWQNCPPKFLPMYFLMDFVRLLGSYFKNFI
jgi:GT2 family glycosyltransferase